MGVTSDDLVARLGMVRDSEELSAVFRVVIHQADRQVLGVVAFVLVCRARTRRALSARRAVRSRGSGCRIDPFENDLGDHADLRVRFKPRLEVLLVGPGIIEDARQASSVGPSLGPECRDMRLRPTARVRRTPAPRIPIELALRQMRRVIAAEVPGGFEDTDRFAVNLLAPRLGRVDHDFPQNRTTKPVDAPGALDQGVERSALGRASRHSRAREILPRPGWR